MPAAPPSRFPVDEPWKKHAIASDPRRLVEVVALVTRCHVG
jgi:hypothetical protein